MPSLLSPESPEFLANDHYSQQAAELECALEPSSEVYLAVLAQSQSVDQLDAARNTHAGPLTKLDRYQLLDALRGLAACIIVLHHATMYAPFSDLADQAAGHVTLTLFGYGAYVVQLFMVLGGFALATAIPLSEMTVQQALKHLVNRYLRLAVPYLAMLLVLLLVASAINSEMTRPLVDSWSLGHVASHLFFLQDLLQFGNLSAGTWYLCIDLQFVFLYLVLQTTLTAIAKRLARPTLLPNLMATSLVILGTLSVWWWNRNAGLDNYVVYFAGSLVLGALVGLALKKAIHSSFAVIYAAIFSASLLADLRPRLLVAIFTAMVIVACARYFSKVSGPRILLWLGRISYCLFLIHYCVNGLVFHMLETWVGSSPIKACLAITAAFLCSVAAGWCLHSFVESPALSWIKNNFSQSKPSENSSSVTSPVASLANARGQDHLLGRTQVGSRSVADPTSAIGWLKRYFHTGS